MTEKRKRWLIAVGYVLFIYATLSLVRAPVSALRSMGLLRISLGILYATCFLSLLAYLIRRNLLDGKRTISLFFIAALYYWVAQWVQTPEEQIHFFQYGLVGFFFLRALKFHTSSKSKRFFFALLLSSAAGWLDEIMQGLTPTRHYDVRDIFLNILSSFLGLITYQILISSREDLKK